MAANSLIGRSAGIGIVAALVIGGVVSVIYVGALWLAGLLIMAALGVTAAIAMRRST